MTADALTIVIFSTFGSEYAPLLIAEFYARGFAVAALILDGVVREKDKRIQEERTKGFFGWPDFFSIAPYKIPMYLVQNHNDEITQQIMQTIAPEVIVNGGTPRILKGPILSLPARGVVSAHPGLLPAYRGCTCVEWALYHDDPVGATCHFITPGIDEGPIIYQETLPIRRGDAYEKVRADMLYHQVRVMTKGLEIVADNDLFADRMPLQGKGTYYKVIPDAQLQAAKARLREGRFRHYADAPRG